MAKNVDPNESDGFESVDNSWNTVSGARRDPPTITVEATGLATSNVAATEMMLPQITEAGEIPQQCDVYFRVKKDKGLVKVLVAKHGEKGAVPVTLSRDKRKISFHLGAVYAQYPSLAANYPRKCPFRREPDGSLVIALLSGVAKRTNSRSGQEDDAAPGSQEAK